MTSGPVVAFTYGREGFFLIRGSVAGPGPEGLARTGAEAHPLTRSSAYWTYMSDQGLSIATLQCRTSVLTHG